MVNSNAHFGTTWVPLALLLALSLPVACTSSVQRVPVDGVVDLAGEAVDPFMGDPAAVVLVFARSDCPISNRYAPEIIRIAAVYADRGVRFWMVYADEDDTPGAIRLHREQFGYRTPALRDMKHSLVRATEVKVTPEVAVFEPSGRLVYAGRIDDQYVAFGKRRAQPTRRDLEEAIDAVLAGGRPRTPRTDAVGCYISPLS